jgi:hypothetical protein
MGAIPTKATPENTKAFLSRYPSQPSKVLGQTGLWCSSFGFGSYRIHEKFPGHREALRTALQKGCNLIDTSSNYGDGAAESLIGDVLQDLIKQKIIDRSEVILVSKGGYLQGSALQFAMDLEKKKKGYQEVVKVQDTCWHCIHPDFLESQIEQSLKRLGLEQLDIYLLHNPEYFLKMHTDPHEYLKRIQKAFEFLETEVEKGRIQYYGVSSNTFPENLNSSTRTSLKELIELAESIKEDHHFKVIQFPFNLFEPNALVEKQENDQTLLERAEAKKMGVLINRPLNALANDKLIRLSDFPKRGEEKALEKNMELRKNEAVSAEAQLVAYLQSNRSEEHEEPIAINLAHFLGQSLSQVEDLIQWKEILSHQIIPKLIRFFQDQQHLVHQTPLLMDYQKKMDDFLQSITEWFETKAHMRSENLKQLIDLKAPEVQKEEALTRKLFSLYLSVPGIHCILLGMRNKFYVEDAFQLDESRIDKKRVKETFEAVSDLIENSGN